MSIVGRRWNGSGGWHKNGLWLEILVCGQSQCATRTTCGAGNVLVRVGCVIVCKTVKVLKHVVEVAVPIDDRCLQAVKGTRAPWTHRARGESELKTMFVTKVATFETNHEHG